MKGGAIRISIAKFDAENNAIVNVSAWDTLNAAEQMASFRPILDLAGEFTCLGVRFGHPILNFERLWMVESGPA